MVGAVIQPLMGSGSHHDRLVVGIDRQGTVRVGNIVVGGHIVVSTVLVDDSLARDVVARALVGACARHRNSVQDIRGGNAAGSHRIAVPRQSRAVVHLAVAARRDGDRALRDFQGVLAGRRIIVFCVCSHIDRFCSNKCLSGNICAPDEIIRAIFHRHDIAGRHRSSDRIADRRAVIDLLRIGQGRRAGHRQRTCTIDLHRDRVGHVVVVDTIADIERRDNGHRSVGVRIGADGSSVGTDDTGGKDFARDIAVD